MRPDLEVVRKRQLPVPMLLCSADTVGNCDAIVQAIDALHVHVKAQAREWPRALGAREIGYQYGWRLVRSFRCAAAIRALTERGDLDAAELLARQVDRELSGSELSVFDLPYPEFKGRLELAHGRPRLALDAFLALRDALPTE